MPPEAVHSQTGLVARLDHPGLERSARSAVSVESAIPLSLMPALSGLRTATQRSQRGMRAISLDHPNPTAYDPRPYCFRGLSLLSGIRDIGNRTASPRRPRRASRVHDRELQDRKRRDAAESLDRVRNVRSSPRRPPQRRHAAVALHGDASRLRMAHRARACARYGEALSRRHGALWQRALLLA